jgi:hypothetical protein
MATFDYTPTNLAELEIRLSDDRLKPYRMSVGGDNERAIRLYEQNTLLAESLYGILQGLEVALRNSIHARLSAGFGRTDWWNAVQLKTEQAMMLRSAEESLQRAGKPLEASRIVAELSFGFWTGLTGPRYSDLWRDHLVKIFPRRPLQRADVQLRLNSIRKLRNRIAHHEPILFGGQLQRYVNQIFDTLSWISPVTARWVRSKNSFEERFAHCRSIFPMIAGKKG